MIRTQHWQDAASLCVGIWLIFSPLALGFGGAAAWTTSAIGIAVVLFAGEGLLIPSSLEEWGEIFLGLALLVAPWTVGYTSEWATASSMIAGLLVLVFALWELITDRELLAWWHARHNHPGT